jgi:RNA polymerase sigma-70 factor (ECF subfamily)
MNDAELIDRFRGGQAAAFNALVWRWQDRLFNFVFRYVGDREEARDLCQQVFIRAYRALGSLRATERFSTWIYQIAVNVCRDRQRRRRQLLSLEGFQEEHGRWPSLLEEHPGQLPPPDARAQARDLRDLLGKALKGLPEEQRVVIIMKEYQGLKFVEIAEILQVPLNTVKSRLYCGLKALRKTFDEWGISEESIGYGL